MDGTHSQSPVILGKISRLQNTRMIFFHNSSEFNKNTVIMILFGGRSSEHEISLLSARDVLKSVDRRRYSLIKVGVDKSGRWFLYGDEDDCLLFHGGDKISLANSGDQIAVIPGRQDSPFMVLSENRTLPAVDGIMSTLHGGSGEDGTISGMLQILGIPHTGSDLSCSAICMDKDITRRVLTSHGVPVIPHTTVLEEDGPPDFDLLAKRHGLPLFVKPSNQGSSIGVNIVEDETELRSAIDSAMTYSDKILIEPRVGGREIEIAVLGAGRPRISECGEIVPGDTFYTYSEKYSGDSNSQLMIPADVGAETRRSVRKMTRKICSALNFGIATRLSFFLAGGQILLNEINTVPGFHKDGMYSRLWLGSGLDYVNLIDRILELVIGDGRKTRKSVRS